MSTSSYSGSYVINGLTAPDNYVPVGAVDATGKNIPPSTIEGVEISWVVIDVVNQAIFWQLKIQTAGAGGVGVWEGAEKQMIPGSKQIVRPNIVGIRFRAVIPAATLALTNSMQAVVTVEAVT